MFSNDDFLSPQRSVQRVGDFFEQRKTFRAAALTALRKREGLPSPVDETGAPLETRFDDFGNATYHSADGKKVDHVLFAGAGRDGKPGGFAIGTRKGVDHAAADRHWHDPDAPFEILEVAEDGRKLEDELKDLHRDTQTYERAARVSHGVVGEQAPELVLDGTSDVEVEARLQEYLKRGPR